MKINDSSWTTFDRLDTGQVLGYVEASGNHTSHGLLTRVGNFGWDGLEMAFENPTRYGFHVRPGYLARDGLDNSFWVSWQPLDCSTTVETLPLGGLLPYLEYLFQFGLHADPEYFCHKRITCLSRESKDRWVTD